MNVSLIVVQGKPEGKVIPLALPRFKIGRGEGCHLRPNNEQISRNHSEIVVSDDQVIVRDLGSRNGTIVNNKRLEPHKDHVLKNKDLIQVGPLTFAVSIQGAPTAAQPTAPTDKADRAMAKATDLDELSNDEIDAWLVSDKDSPAPERPSGVYTGDTMAFSAYKESKSDPEAKAAEPKPEEPKPEEPKPEEPADEPEEPTDEADEDIYDKLEDEDDTDAVPEEFVDESNPFYSAKKQQDEPDEAAKKKEEINSSQAAEDILRKMMERRRAAR